MDGGLALVLVAFIGLGGIIFQGLIALQVARVGAEVKKVHTAVNSERSAMISKLEELLGQNFTLKGAAAERVRADDAAPTAPAEVVVVNPEPLPVVVAPRT